VKSYCYDVALPEQGEGDLAGVAVKAEERGAAVTISRRTFLGELAASGALAGLLTKPETAAALAAALDDPVTDTSAGTGAAFWGSFLAKAPHERGLMGHKLPGTDADRQVNYLHFGDQGLRYADQIPNDELPDYPGDVAVSMQVGGIRLSSADRQKFEQLQSAQLRIDMMQGKPMFNMIDPLAWMALAAIFPDEGGKLPPLQNLSFDPSTSAQNMQKILLPGGVGHMAVNVSMVHKESEFWTVIKTLVNDASRVAPVLGFPAISMTALAGFSKLYGVLANRSVFLFQARPQQAFATQAAREQANSTIGINVPTGDYVLVPQSHTDDLKPYLDNLKLANGYMIPKDAPDTSSVYETAAKAQPDISYITIHLSVTPMTEYGNGESSGSSGSSSSSSSSSSTTKKKSATTTTSSGSKSATSTKPAASSTPEGSSKPDDNSKPESSSQPQ
jgi:hypothetical protein